MAKTYLQLVNSVLTRVREPTVGSITASNYSTLIGEYVNDAKRAVEDAWNWMSLWKTVNFSLTAGIRTYDLSSTALVGAGSELNERARLLFTPEGRPLAFDVTTTDPFPLRYVSRQSAYSTEALIYPVTTSSTPGEFALFWDSDAPTVFLTESPTAARNWRLEFKKPQDELSADSDTIKVPWLPVVLLATNYALAEKGEEVGQPGNEAEKKYLNALADAIAADSIGNPDYTTFIAV